MKKKLLEKVPEKVRALLGSKSTVCLLSGRDLFNALRNEKLIIMGCNTRIRHAIPGIMRAAEELDAVVAFELTRTEGGLDGGYTGQTPNVFFETVIGYAEQMEFTKPFIIHGDHITVADTSAEDFEHASLLVKAQIASGYTSFAFDASLNQLQDNINIVSRLSSAVMDEGYGLELELGDAEPGSADPSRLTTPGEAEEFLSAVERQGVKPQLLAINNGSKRGNYLDGEAVRIDLAGTKSIYEIAQRYGLTGLVQQGITGTPLHLVGKLAEYGIRKANIGTLWQNVAHAGLPLDLMDQMRKWARKNRLDIKYATGVFKNDIDSIPPENVSQIHDMAYREAKDFIAAFYARGSASKVAQALLEES